MSPGIHPDAASEYRNSIRWMKDRHYNQRVLARFIDRIETGLVAIDDLPREFPPYLADEPAGDIAGRPRPYVM